MQARVIAYGATLQAMIVPDRTGALADVTLGHASLGEYLEQTAYFGSSVGRVANRIAGGRFIVGAALRREATGADGRVLIGGIAPGPATTIETQMSSLTDFTLRPARAGDSLTLRPGEIRHVPIALRPTASIEVQVLLVAADQRTPRSGVTVMLRDAEGREAARALTDFDGYVLFEGLAFGAYRAEAAGQTSAALTVSREVREAAARLLIPAG
jgi:hypothetical protein